MRLKIIGLIAVLLLALSGSVLAADNWQFVDARGATGYYIDVDAITYETATETVKEATGDPAKPFTEVTKSRELINTRIAVIKARQNRRFIYALRFDPEKRTYQIFATKTEVYDTREKIASTVAAQNPLAYTPSSPMAAIVSYIGEYSAEVARQKANAKQ